MNFKSYKDQVVIITGASSGIGRALALDLAAQGAVIVLAARTAQQLAAVQSECVKLGAKATMIATDIASQEQCENLIKKTIETYGRIDVLINNAGISMYAKFEDLSTIAHFRDLMEINYFGSVNCTYYALPHLKQSRGQIIAVSSLAGKFPFPTRSGYVASKHAMTAFFETLRIELQASGVSVTIAYPDFVVSAIRERALGKDGQQVGTEKVEYSNIMTAEDCAQRILKGAARRKRDVILTARGHIALWLKLLAPGFLDRMLGKTAAGSKVQR